MRTYPRMLTAPANSGPAWRVLRAAITTRLFAEIALTPLALLTIERNARVQRACGRLGPPSTAKFPAQRASHNISVAVE